MTTAKKNVKKNYFTGENITKGEYGKGYYDIFNIKFEMRRNEYLY